MSPSIPYSFADHKSLLWDNEWPVSFSRYGFGPFGAEPGHINFQDGLNKGPWWRHLESYYLGLMNFWQRAVWFMVPNTQANAFRIHRPFTSRLCPQRAFGLHISNFFCPWCFIQSDCLVCGSPYQSAPLVLSVFENWIFGPVFIAKLRLWLN